MLTINAAILNKKIHWAVTQKQPISGHFATLVQSIALLFQWIKIKV